MKLSTHRKNAPNDRTADGRPHGKTVMRNARSIAAMLFAALIVSGCGAMVVKQNKQSASLVDYVYSGQQAPEKIEQASITDLHFPLKIGIAFVPGTADPKFGITEVEQLGWSTQLKAAFQRHRFVGDVTVIPTAYLKSGGGLDNLRQLATLFNVDVIALLSYDQTQFSEPNNLSFMYWTIIGAYMVPGDQYDVHTVLEAAVFDARTGKLLFRAPGTSTVQGSATLAGFVNSSRRARSEGFDKAFQQMIPNVDTALQDFHRQLQIDPSIRLSLPEGDDVNAPRRSPRETAAR